MGILSNLPKYSSEVYEHVWIGDIELGVRREDAPDTSKPNPSTIHWHKEFVIVKHKVVGKKPKTQCTVPDGLWYCDLEVTTLDNAPEVLDKILDMKAGPHRVKTYKHDHCMWVESIDETQTQGTKDYYQRIKLTFCENNP